MKKNVSFEVALTSLEEAVRILESGDVSLDESLRLFGDCVSLIKICNEKLDAAEKKVRMLVSGEDGSVDDVPFDIDNEA